MRSWIGVLLVCACGGAPTSSVVSPAEGPSAPSASSARATSDRPDEADGYQVHVVYAVPKGGEDRELDTNETLAHSASAMNAWLASQSGGAKLRFDTANGALDVTYAALPSTDAEIAAQGEFLRERIQSELAELGLDAPNKLYAVYYDGSTTVACGSGPWPPELVGRAVVSYLRATPDGVPPCDSNPWPASHDAPAAYRELSMLHEVFHGLGAAPSCAPNHTLAGHTKDTPTDLMYAGDDAWAPSVLDEGATTTGDTAARTARISLAVCSSTRYRTAPRSLPAGDVSTSIPGDEYTYGWFSVGGGGGRRRVQSDQGEWQAAGRQLRQLVVELELQREWQHADGGRQHPERCVDERRRAGAEGAASAG